jgi:predicted transcriptional regulator of viral defense system
MTKYDDIIYEIASDNFGLITSAEAREAGITNNELVQYARRGRLERIGQGVYRLTQRIPEENDPYAVAVALVDPDAYLYGEGVLGLLNLCPVNPAYIPVATTKRVRKKLPGYIRLVNTASADDVETYDGIPAQNAAAAIDSCMQTVLPDRLLSATDTAFAQGYISAQEKDRLIRELEELTSSH